MTTSDTPRRRSKGLLFDIMVSNVALIGLALACLTTTFLHLESRVLRYQMNVRAESLARIGANAVAPYLASGDRAGLERALGALLASRDAVYVEVTGASGDASVFASQPGFDKARVPRLAAVAQSESNLVSIAGGPSILEARQPVWVGKARLGSVRAGVSLGTERDILSDTLWSALDAALLALILLNLTQYLQLRKLLEPLADLAALAVRLARGGDAEKMKITRADEVGELGVAFNGLIDQVRSRRELALLLHKAQEANRLQGEFLANVSHQLRTPMNGIIGMTELALGTEVTGEQREYLENVTSSSESLLHLLDDILDFSKIVAGKFELDRQPFSLRDLIGQTVRALAIRAHQKNLELMWDIEENVPDHLIGDSTRLRQVVVNLVGNAVKFTEAGEILVRVQLKERSSEQISLLFQVRDTGIGISPEKRKTIFEAFTHSVASTTSMQGPTGLGLAICSRLVHLMQGDISVDSEPAKGSTFQFTAVFAPAPRLATALTTHATEPLRGVPVLIVDDNRTNLRILDRLLTNWGCQTYRAESPEDGMRLVRAARGAGTPFRIILLDATMPDRAGLSMAADVRSEHGHTETIIMMLSSVTLPEDAAHCRSIGITSYLTKPVAHAALRAAMYTALENVVSIRSGRRAGRSADEVPSGLSILVAEDNPVNQRLAVRLLERKGHRVVTASNGREAVAAVERTHFDLILMDVQMPEMDGLAATAGIREHERLTGSHVPILASTAHAMGGDRERCLQSGMDGYVSKPFKPEALYAAIEEVIHRVSAMPPSKSGEYRRTSDDILSPIPQR
jgi:signal transduction histidine kinase/CheY-like chemotaxis protein